MPRVHHKPASRPRGLSLLSPPLLALAAVLILAAMLLLLLPRDVQPVEVDAARAHQMYLDGALFVDVRSQAEWNQGHIQGSLLIPLDLLQDSLDKLPRDRDIVVVCRVGVRSRAAVEVLRSAGFNRSTCMTGGINAWVAAGYPVGR